MSPERKPAPQLPNRVLDFFSLKGKVAVVTGASGPIGDTVAQGFAEAGADVVMLYSRDDAAVRRAPELAKANGVKVTAVQLDVRDHAATDKVINGIIADFGKIDIWVANAGVIQEDNTIIDVDPKAIENIIHINYTAIIYQAALLGKYWQAHATAGSNTGRFIITASAAGTSNIRPLNQAVYNSSKAAAKSLAQSLAQEFKDFARVNSVSPGYMGDAQGADELEITNALSRQVLNRTGEYRELQGAYLFLASDASTFCTGHDLIVDGGYTV